MQTFTSEELQRRPAEVEQAALGEPTFITFRGRPRLVMMSVDEFDRMRGRRHKVLEAVDLSAGILEQLQRMADEALDDDAELTLLGGLLDNEAGSNSPPTR